MQRKGERKQWPEVGRGIRGGGNGPVRQNFKPAHGLDVLLVQQTQKQYGFKMACVP